MDNAFASTYVLLPSLKGETFFMISWSTAFGAIENQFVDIQQWFKISMYLDPYEKLSADVKYYARYVPE